ncbi:MAG: HAD family hydrolase [Candidatus Thiodiazotropha sp.]
MKKRKHYYQSKIAIVYDFDGTLSPQPMQEYTVLPELGIRSIDFWKEVSKQARDTEAESMLVYMRLLIEKADSKKIHLGKEELAKLAKEIKYFPGVETWFKRINNYVKEISHSKSKIEHYIISAGMKEILIGSSIKKEFKNIFASEYHFNHHGVAIFPKQIITDTTKTQFLFRINKGKQKLTESINQHMPEHKRPIPFSNIIYIGDGLTDVPSMVVTKQNGGHSIAVYKPKSKNGLSVCKDLLKANRVHFIAPADYKEDGILNTRIKLLLRAVISSIDYDRKLYACRRENSLLSD